MGTRINVFLSHDLPRFDDAAATIARLDGVLPEALAVRDYWRSVDPQWDPKRPPDHWEADPANPALGDVRRYSGPGSLHVWVMPLAARIHTGGRWRGFLSIEPLRQVHLAAFRAIARAIGSPKLAICSDARDDVADLIFYAGRSQDDCIGALRSAFGTPQPSVDSIAPSVAAQAEHGVPLIWFLDDWRERND